MLCRHCMQNATSEKPAEFSTKTQSWQTALDSSLQFWSVPAMPRAQNSGEGKGKAEVGFRVSGHKNNGTGVRWRSFTTVHTPKSQRAVLLGVLRCHWWWRERNCMWLPELLPDYLARNTPNH